MGVHGVHAAFLLTTSAPWLHHQSWRGAARSTVTTCGWCGCKWTSSGQPHTTRVWGGADCCCSLPRHEYHLSLRRCPCRQLHHRGRGRPHNRCAIGSVDTSHATAVGSGRPCGPMVASTFCGVCLWLVPPPALHGRLLGAHVAATCWPVHCTRTGPHQPGQVSQERLRAGQHVHEVHTATVTCNRRVFGGCPARQRAGSCRQRMLRQSTACTCGVW